ncbi:TPA: type IV secretion system DNA-binding domain-containing protein [Vibrio parahaemolyticus]|uniref:type IV secretion system DNA-binding domain-containing protein n=1 Tax=Vibrio parahaemolyticus TaxID=670 RepID=UPI00081A54F2|nr:type IV secretion system DNA-binding domain-containing protein [Vibrio parahaemolyticus]ANZ08764.1 TraD protein [Vibrio parahaemolyticus]EGQ8098827.1 type IV secretion system DNA-binding domain-containing protein [Vibrio parahaemolyticus]EGQ9287512.1 type IV secretion system DNA-binding domain-containing protein [Vibrio parahaemolyticus]MCX8891396.1 type IV secretion system DNA-binding domain-containing protein [Vibrio parahaemolyticus]MCX8946894.1 type IV secretion system DNA-binding domai
MATIRKGRVGDFVRGADTWLHSQQMLLFSGIWIFLPGVLLAIVGGLLYIGIDADKCVLQNASTYLWAQLKALVQPFSSLTIGTCVALDGRDSLPSSVVINEPLFQEAAVNLLKSFGWAFSSLFVLYLPIGVYLVVKAVKRGKEIKEDKYIRGAKLVSAEKLKGEIVEKHGVSDLTLGDFPIPTGFSKKHTLISGTTGAGKSTALTHLLKAIRARGDRAVVYDKKGEFVEMFYRDGVDHILNPADSRSHQWTPWEEMESPFDADWISETLLPSSNSNSGSEKFFTSAARAVVSAALQNLYLDGPKSLLSLLRATAWNDLELLKELVAGTPAETYFNEDNERTLESIRSTIVDGVRPLRLLKEENKKGFFSIRDWIVEGDEPNADDSWLFLPVRESEIEIQKPLISTWIQAAAKGLMARGVNNERTLWIVVDELPSLKKIPALSMLMAEGRGFGAAVVLGIQEINQLEEEFGKNTSKTILGLCSTQFHFRLNNADTAEWVSKVLGEAEREEVDEDLNYSADDIRDGVRVSSKRQSRKIVLPSEIMDLPDLSCFAKIWGVESKARIDIPFLRLPKIADGFIQGDENETVGMRLLNAARAMKMEADTDLVPKELSNKHGTEGSKGQLPALSDIEQEVHSVLGTDGVDDDLVFGLLGKGGKKS